MDKLFTTIAQDIKLYQRINSGAKLSINEIEDIKKSAQMLNEQTINWQAYKKGQEAWRQYLKDDKIQIRSGVVSSGIPKNPYKKNTPSWYSWNRGWNSL